MNLEMLNKLSTEGLHKLKESIEQVLDSRLDRTLRVGRVADFMARGESISIVITRINGKTVSGEEIGTSVKPGRKWRVGKELAKVRPLERRASGPVRFAQPSKPQTGADAAW